MKNTFGTALTVTLFGESHGEAVGAVIDGLAPGIEIDIEYLNHKLAQRRSHASVSTKRVERDEVSFLSGVFEGHTTGSPVCLIIRNENARSGDYAELKRLPRPSHADYTAEVKYHGFQDYRGGGHFSGRVTAALVAAGAVISKALERKGIYIGTHISRLAGISDRPFFELGADISYLSTALFPVLEENAAQIMTQKILDAAAELDSVGGVLETAVIGVPAGVGEPWFDSVESVLSHILFSVPAIKGVEFGDGFGLADMRGSEANDPFAIKDGRVITSTNRSGGINGGITNGMPIIFRCAVKPTPSIYKKQTTVDIKAMKETELQIKGRHDPAIIHRARAVVDAVTAIAVADLLTVKFGTDYLYKD